MNASGIIHLVFFGARLYERPMTRTAIIGDVHGLSGPLQHLVETLALEAGDTLIFVGDLIDKGPDPIGTVRYAAMLARSAAFDVVLVEGNHEDRHRRYRRNLDIRPTVAAEQAASEPELPTLTNQLGPEETAFLDSAVLFHRIRAHDMLVVHGGVPGDMAVLPDAPGDVAHMAGKQRKHYQALLRTRYIKASDGSYLALGKNTPDDPYWAQVYDGRFGHVVFGHQPFLNGPAHFPHATGIDTGAVHGGALTALVIAGDGARSYVQVPGEMHVPPKQEPLAQGSIHSGA